MRFERETGRIFARDESGKLLAEVTFPDRDGAAEIDHTFVDPSLEGRGVAGQLLQAAADALRRGECALVLVAQDLSEKTRKNMRFEADRAGAALLETAFTMEDIAAAIGKKTGVLAVCDAGFAEKLKQELGAVSEERAYALHASEKDR